jgi:hypothetical protein
MSYCSNTVFCLDRVLKLYYAVLLCTIEIFLLPNISAATAKRDQLYICWDTETLSCISVMLEVVICMLFFFLINITLEVSIRTLKIYRLGKRKCAPLFTECISFHTAFNPWIMEQKKSYFYRTGYILYRYV